MRTMTGVRTHKLATARLEFSRDRRLRSGLHLATVAALVVLALALGARFYLDGDAPASRLAAMQRENATLRADLARVRTELELERSAHAAVAGQVAELNERAGQLKAQVDFFNTQSGRPGKAR